MNCKTCGKGLRLQRNDQCVACRWIDDQTKVANKWFDGDLDRAERVLDVMPYSTIPGWHDVAAVMEAIDSES